MDLQNTWQQSSNSDEILDHLLGQKDLGLLPSKLPLKKLRNYLLKAIISAALLTAGYLSLFFLVSLWQVYVALGSLIAFNAWVMVDGWRLYKKTSETITPSFSLKQELEKNYNSFQRWWSIQVRISVFIFPVAIAGGFILGGALGSGKPVESFLYNSHVLALLGITIVVLSPLCYYLAIWMFDYTYGKHLKKLKLLIEELSY